MTIAGEEGSCKCRRRRRCLRSLNHDFPTRTFIFVVLGDDERWEKRRSNLKLQGVYSLLQTSSYVGRWRARNCLPHSSTFRDSIAAPAGSEDKDPPIAKETLRQNDFGGFPGGFVYAHHLADGLVARLEEGLRYWRAGRWLSKALASGSTEMKCKSTLSTLD